MSASTTTSAGRFNGRVAFVTGAARGQGRSHAVQLAAEGADIIAVDICDQIDSVGGYYALATEDDLAETVQLVEALGRRIVAAKADVRDFARLKQVLDDGVAQLGRLDIVCANAGIFTFGPSLEVEPQAWRDVIDVNVTGVWKTCRAATPHLLATGAGSVIITCSTAGLKGYPNTAAYTASKHAVIGLMRSFALSLGPHNVRVNCVVPTSVRTPMTQNVRLFRLIRPELESPGPDDVRDLFAQLHALPVPWVDPSDVSQAVLFLASDDAKNVTGTILTIDGGFTIM